MKKYSLFVSLLGCLVLLNACQKEYSYEVSSISSGYLQSDVSGDCLPKSIQGVYEVGNSLEADSNYIDVTVNVSAIGTYHVYSDTSNGIFFQAKGVFSMQGTNTVRLVGNGTPVAAGMHHFRIQYDSTECMVTVTTLPKGATEPAIFTFTGGPVNCLDFNLAGTYIKGIALTDANKVDIKVNVTKIGTWQLTTSSGNGISFSGTGSFSATGDQIITLTASGTPVETGLTPIDINGGNSGCSFPVDVSAGAEYTIDCASAAVNGTYEEAVTLDASHTVDIDVNVTSTGPYSISTTPVNGISFSATGNFTTTGAYTISLVGQGTPAADGQSDFVISGSSACGFGLTVEQGTDLKWKFTAAGTTFGGETETAVADAVLGVNILSVSGASSTGFGSWNVSLTNTAGNIAAGVYSGTATSGKFAVFTFSDGVNIWQAMPGSGSSLPVTITVYNTTDKVIEGTFSGTAKDIAGATVNITAGSFKARLP